MTHKSEYLVQAKPKSGDWVTLSIAGSEEQALAVRDQYRDPLFLREHTSGWDWTGEVRAILRETEVVTHVSEIVLEGKPEGPERAPWVGDPHKGSPLGYLPELD